MKSLLLLCCLSLTFVAMGQALPLPMIPTDSVTGKVTYQGVVQVPGVSADELYSRAREWFSASFNSGKSVLDMDDRISGKLLGSGYSTFSYTALISAVQYPLWRTVKVYVKDGRYRYELTEFTVGGAYVAGGISSGSNTKTPIENYIGPLSYKNPFMWDRKGNPKALTRAMIDAVNQSATGQVASLATSMNAAHTAKKEW